MNQSTGPSAMFPHKHLAGNSAREAVSEWRHKGGAVVLAVGCFDLFHIGCVKFLHDAAAHGNHMLVGVLDDAAVSRIKGAGRPVLPLPQRLDMVAAMEPVTAVMPLNMDDIDRVISELSPDFVIMGEEYERACPLPEPENPDSCRVVVGGGMWQTCSDWLIDQIRDTTARRPS